MLDDEARRTLEEEAIALVSLSDPSATMRFRRAESYRTSNSSSSSSTSSKTTAHPFAAMPCRQQEEHLERSGHHQASASRSGVHSLLQVHACLDAQRDAKHPAPARKSRLRTDGTVPVKNGSVAGSNSTLAPRTLAPATHATEELYAQNPAVSDDQQALDAQNSNISMKSLLVTLKKRKLGTQPGSSTSDAEAAKVLPSFRDVFEASQQPPAGSASASGSQAPQPTSAVDASGGSGTAAEAGAPQAIVPTQVLSSAELKCKYRTGKCNNVRALKSCGDYHNLCNYHRLRANANQRKLDRKKKVQRLQIIPGGAAALAAAEAAAAAASESLPLPQPTAPMAALVSSPASVAAASALLCAPSAAAAAALVAMPTSSVSPLGVTLYPAPPTTTTTPPSSSSATTSSSRSTSECSS